MVRFFITILFIGFGFNSFAVEEEDSSCSDWLLHASAEGYEAAFDRWKTYTDKAQALIEIAKRADSQHSSPLSREQLRAARLLSGWYSALIHLGSLAPVESISANKKLRALRHAAGESFDDTMVVAYPLPQISTSGLPEHVREFYEWSTLAVENGFPTGAIKPFYDQVVSLAEAGS